MRRILLMALRNFFLAPYLYLKMRRYAKDDSHTMEEKFELLRRVTAAANKGGRVLIEVEGKEHIPKENGYIMYPNHQGLYDVLAFLEGHPHMFSVVMKKELTNLFFLKQVFILIKAHSIDREDVRQSMMVMKQVTEEVKQGRNFVIFAEGTRSKNGNELLEFKGGSFKSAMNAKCPIVPIAIIDSYKVMDTKSIRPATVKIHYLPPLYYEDYKGMKSTQIAEKVREMISEEIKRSE